MGILTQPTLDDVDGPGVLLVVWIIVGWLCVLIAGLVVYLLCVLCRG